MILLANSGINYEKCLQLMNIIAKPRLNIINSVLENEMSNDDRFIETEQFIELVNQNSASFISKLESNKFFDQDSRYNVALHSFLDILVLLKVLCEYCKNSDVMSCNLDTEAISLISKIFKTISRFIIK